MRAIVFVVSLSIIAVQAGPVHGKTITVGPGDSIQAAVDQAKPGDTVAVKPRTSAPFTRWLGSSKHVAPSAPCLAIAIP